MKKFLLTLTILTITFNACKKDDDSNYVTKGSNINTVQTYNFTVYSWDWSGGSTEKWYDYQNFSMNLDGGVQVYLYDNVLGGWFALPCAVSNISYYIEVFPDIKAVWVYIANVDGTSSITAPSSSLIFKIVTIPPSARIANPNLNWNNYKEVKNTFNLVN